MDDLPEHIVVSLRLLSIYVLVVFSGLIYNLFNANYPYIPFVRYLDVLSPKVFSTVCVTILLLSLGSIFLKYRLRLCSFLAGLSLIVVIISSKPVFSNTLLFTSCLFILTAFYNGKDNWLIRIQLFLVYFGAGINKLFIKDWWGGHYFDYFLREVYNVPIYSSFIQEGELMLASSLGICVIVIEILLAVLSLMPQRAELLYIIGFLFHLVMLIVTRGQLSLNFLYLISLSYFMLIKPLTFKTIVMNDRLLPYFTKVKSSSWYNEQIFLNSKTNFLGINNQISNQVISFVRFILINRYVIYIYFGSIILYKVCRDKFHLFELFFT